MSADISLESISKPYRPGTSYFQFGTPDKYYWLCVVPRGKVSGMITVEGKTKSITGMGYHDHQWGSINFHKYWNHWIWARQSYDDCSLLLFDFFTNEEYGTKRFPIIFIQDNNGNIIFESHNNIECKIEKQYVIIYENCNEDDEDTDTDTGFLFTLRCKGRIGNNEQRRPCQQKRLAHI